MNPLQVSPQVLPLQREAHKSLYNSPGPCFLDCPIDPYMLTASRHLGSDPDLPNTILKGDYTRTSVTIDSYHMYVEVSKLQYILYMI